MIHWVLHRNQCIQPPNHPATMVSKRVPIGTNNVKEPSIKSTKMLNIIAADQAGVMNLIIDAELKQNSKLFVHNVRSSISHSREVFWETCLFDQHEQGERTRLFLCPWDYKITKWVHQLPTFGQSALISIICLEGGYSHTGWVTPLCWHQDIRVQMAQTNIKQYSTTSSDKLIALELQYKIKASMCNVMSFQDWPQELDVTIEEKGKILDEK